MHLFPLESNISNPHFKLGSALSSSRNTGKCNMVLSSQNNFVDAAKIVAGNVYDVANNDAESQRIMHANYGDTALPMKALEIHLYVTLVGEYDNYGREEKGSYEMGVMTVYDLNEVRKYQNRNIYTMSWVVPEYERFIRKMDNTYFLKMPRVHGGWDEKEGLYMTYK
jgi:hypothetical protein